MDMPDRTWRVFTSALMWSAEQGTDGDIPDRYVRMLHPEGADEADLAPLLDAGLLVKREGGYTLAGWSDPNALRQSTDEQVKSYRQRKRENQAAYRQRRRESGNVTGNEGGHVAPHVGEGFKSPKGNSSAYTPGHVTGNASHMVSVAPGSDCGTGRHRIIGDGTCMNCEYRTQGTT